ncbi:MAG: glycosyltransferase family 39 protein, partial [Candidatus Ryanbacteria bacterium]|nr:glycosyltransferase family 39 protein [Candidatus Ryanbacteria bacterium]
GREGLFINLQALSVGLLGHSAFALRLVSAIFGILTVLGLYFFTREYVGNERIALLAAFLLATSFWHINFSRIGFRAIMAPFFLVVGFGFFYYVWNRRRSKRHIHILFAALLGGIFFGLGFHSYIAYRAAPILLLPLLWLFYKDAGRHRESCTLCIPAIFLFGILLAVLPLLFFFGQHPDLFFGRTSQISIFSEPDPLKLFWTNIGKTVGMLYLAGDFNWRHNWAGEPALWWPVAIFFTLGILMAIRRRYAVIILWLSAMILPVVISSERIPHALRSIIIIPPIFVLAALGLDFIWRRSTGWLKRMETEVPEAAIIIRRIQKLTYLLVLGILFGISVRTFNLYFQSWAIRPEVAVAFQADLTKGH